MTRQRYFAAGLSTLALVAGCFRSESPTSPSLPGMTPTPAATPTPDGTPTPTPVGTATPTPSGTPTPTPTPGGTPTPTPTPGGTPTPTPVPTPTPTPTPPPAPTLSQIQASIFTPSCGGSSCHSGASPQESLNLAAGATWGSAVNVPSMQQGGLSRIAPGNPSASYLVRKLEGGPGISGQQMPRGGPFLSPAEIQQVRDWITAGALNN